MYKWKPACLTSSFGAVGVADEATLSVARRPLPLPLPLPLGGVLGAKRARTAPDQKAEARRKNICSQQRPPTGHCLQTPYFHPAANTNPLHSQHRYSNRRPAVSVCVCPRSECTNNVCFNQTHVLLMPFDSSNAGVSVESHREGLRPPLLRSFYLNDQCTGDGQVDVHAARAGGGRHERKQRMKETG